MHWKTKQKKSNLLLKEPGKGRRIWGKIQCSRCQKFTQICFSPLGLYSLKWEKPRSPRSGMKDHCKVLESCSHDYTEARVIVHNVWKGNLCSCTVGAGACLRGQTRTPSETRVSGTSPVGQQARHCNTAGLGARLDRVPSSVHLVGNGYRESTQVPHGELRQESYKKAFFNTDWGLLGEIP